MSYIANDDGKYLYNATYADNIFLEDYVQRTVIVEKNKIYIKSIGEDVTSPGTWHGLPRPVRATMNMKMYKPGSDSLDEKIIAEVCK